MSTETLPSIGLLGGTGKEGGGLALRWAHAGYVVTIGSRDAQKAAEVAKELNALLGRDGVRGGSNQEAAAASDIVVLTVPYAAQASTLSEVREALQGKILIDVTVPLVPPKVAQAQVPEGGSAVAAMQRLLGAEVRVVSAFQNVSAHHLKDLSQTIECDVLVCSDDRAAAETVVGLAQALGLQAYDAGVLANSVVSEMLTSVLIAINKRYKVPSSGIRITGVGRGSAV
jgi:8-hydroxy-5-deazaflavin:NADPH oxidoreductase